jgi:hypothetical protein
MNDRPAHPPTPDQNTRKFVPAKPIERLDQRRPALSERRRIITERFDEWKRLKDNT